MDLTMSRSLRPERISRHYCSCYLGVWNSRDNARWTFMRPFLTGMPFLAWAPPYLTEAEIGSITRSPLDFLAWIRTRIHSMRSVVRPRLPQRCRQRRACDLRSRGAMYLIAGSMSPHRSKFKWFSIGLYLMKFLKQEITSKLKGESPWRS